MSAAQTLLPRPAIPLSAFALTLAAVLLWGFSPIATRYMVGNTNAGLPVFAFSALRYGIASLALLPLLWQGRHWALRDWVQGALLGLIGFTGFNLPVSLGIQTVSAGLAGLIIGAQPLIIMVLGALFARRMPRPWTLFATFIALCGLVLLTTANGPALGSAKGMLLVLLGALFWGLYCVLSPALLRRNGPLAVSALTMLSGTVPMLALGAPATPLLLHMMTRFDWELTIIVALTCSALAGLCWNAGSAGLGAQKASWFLYLIPLVSLAGGAILLHEPIKLNELIGGGMILFSVYLAQK